MKLLLVSHLNLQVINNNTLHIFKYLSKVIQNIIDTKKISNNKHNKLNLDILTYYNINIKYEKIIQNVLHKEFGIQVNILFYNLDDYLSISSISDIFNNSINSNNNIPQNLNNYSNSKTYNLYRYCVQNFINPAFNICNNKQSFLKYQTLIFSFIKFIMDHKYNNILMLDTLLYRWIFDISVNNEDFKNKFIVFNSLISIMFFENINYKYLEHNISNELVSVSKYIPYYPETNTLTITPIITEKIHIFNYNYDTIKNLINIVNFFTLNTHIKENSQYLYAKIYIICEYSNYLKYGFNRNICKLNPFTNINIDKTTLQHKIIKCMNLDNINMDIYKKQLYNIVNHYKGHKINTTKNLQYFHSKNIKLATLINLDDFNIINNNETKLLDTLKYNTCCIITVIYNYYLSFIKYLQSKNKHIQPYKQKINLDLFLINQNIITSQQIHINTLITNIKKYIDKFISYLLLHKILISFEINIKYIDDLFIKNDCLNSDVWLSKYTITMNYHQQLDIKNLTYDVFCNYLYMFSKNCGIDTSIKDYILNNNIIAKHLMIDYKSIDNNTNIEVYDLFKLFCNEYNIILKSLKHIKSETTFEPDADPDTYDKPDAEPEHKNIKQNTSNHMYYINELTLNYYDVSLENSSITNNEIIPINLVLDNMCNNIVTQLNKDINNIKILQDFVNNNKEYLEAIIKNNFNYLDSFEYPELVIKEYEKLNNNTFSELHININFLKKKNVDNLKEWYYLLPFIKDYKLQILTILESKNIKATSDNVSECFEYLKTAIVTIPSSDFGWYFRYWCYYHINFYRLLLIKDLGNRDKVSRLKNVNEYQYKSVFIEFRNIPHIETIILNTVYQLERSMERQWKHMILCGNLNYTLCKRITDFVNAVFGYEIMTVYKFNIDNLTQDTYSKMLLTPKFWNLISLSNEKNYLDRVLIYQEDSFMFNGYRIKEFLEYDYIGAPWIKDERHNSYNVGNGGFSLRNPKIMLEIATRICNKSDYDIPEDVYFTKKMLEYNLGKLATWDVAKGFSTELISHNMDKELPVGGHKWWWSMNYQDCKKLLSKSLKYLNNKIKFINYNYNKKTLFYINDVWGGGAKLYMNDIIKYIGEDYNVEFKNIKSKKDLYNTNFKINDILILQYFILNNIENIDIINVVNKYKLRLIIPIHDFYWFNKNKDYHIFTNSTSLNYLYNNKNIEPNTIEIFKLAYKIITPSQFVFNEYNKYFIDNNILLKNMDIIEHIDYKINSNTLITLDNKNIINIGIITSLSIYKGIELYEFLVKKNIHTNNIRFIFFNDYTEKFKKYKNCISIKEYNETELFNMIINYKINGFLLFNKYGETYSYALSKIISLNLPIYYTNIGAFKYRLNKLSFNIHINTNNNYYNPYENIEYIYNLNIFQKKFIEFIKNINNNKKYISTINYNKTIDILHKNLYNKLLLNNIHYKPGINIVLITSKIIVSNNKFNYADNRSIYSINERYKQTLDTISSIRKYIPYSYIVLFDNSDLKRLTNLNINKDLINKTDTFINITNDKLDFFTNKCEYKAFGETCQITHTYKYINELKNNYEVLNFFKISGRYLVNDNFNYTDYYNNDTIHNNIFKNANIPNKPTYYYTSFYKISNTNLQSYYNVNNELIQDYLDYKVDKNLDLEILLPSRLNFTTINTLGITQNISVWKDLSNI